MEARLPPATAINLKPKAQLTDILFKMVCCVQVTLNTRSKVLFFAHIFLTEANSP